MGIFAGRADVRIEPAPQQAHRRVRVDRHVEDGRAFEQCDFDHFARPAASARRLPVPDRDQQVAVGDRRAPGHDISGQGRVAAAGQFEHRPRLAQQGMKAVARLARGKILFIGGALERQHGFDGHVLGDGCARRQLVGPLGQGGDEADGGSAGRKQRRMDRRNVGQRGGDGVEQLAQAGGDPLRLPVELLGAVAGDAEGKRERDARRATGGRRSAGKCRDPVVADPVHGSWPPAGSRWRAPLSLQPISEPAPGKMASRREGAGAAAFTGLRRRGASRSPVQFRRVGGNSRRLRPRPDEASRHAC